MALDLTNFLSDNAKSMRRSAIRDLLKVANRPEIISFGGGFPNAKTFPVDNLKEIINELLDKRPAQVLQYGSTEGSVALRTQIAKKYEREGVKVGIDNILITTASQQALDLISRIFINPGDTVLCGLPSYMGALQAIWSYQGRPVGIRHDEEAEAVVSALCSVGQKPKFIYAIPDFQNPTGVTMDLKRRQEIIDVARRHDLIIIEDSPYKELRYEGESYPTMYSMAPERVVLLGTFIGRLIVAKQSADLCTPILNQEVAALYMEKGYYDKNLQTTIDLYRHKRDLMHQYLTEYMPEGVTWTRPDGGLFLLVSMPEGLDAKELFEVAIKENVAFVIGEVFFCDGTGQNTMRLNFSYVSDEDMLEGVKRLGSAIRKLMDSKK